MKKTFKICFCILLLGVIVGAVGIAQAYENTKAVLSDVEMSKVYGGGACQYCGSNGDGCLAGSGGGTACDYASGVCDQYIITSCLQAQQTCINDITLSSCTPDPKPCAGQYTIIRCKKQIVGGVWTDCYWASDPPADCGGAKTGC